MATNRLSVTVVTATMVLGIAINLPTGKVQAIIPVEWGITAIRKEDHLRKTGLPVTMEILPVTGVLPDQEATL
jgi:hypothetical protein